ncbi:MAG: hypothetical protein AAF725_09515 [Acidobacteriota bacterium]
MLRNARLLLLVLAAALLTGPTSTAQNPAAGRSGEGPEESLETFDPSEEVPAETAVAFPVDI